MRSVDGAPVGMAATGVGHDGGQVRLAKASSTRKAATWLLAGVNVVLVGAALALAVLNHESVQRALQEFFVATVSASVSMGFVGTVLVLKRPFLRLGWLLVATGLACAIPGLTAQYARYAVLTRPGALPGGQVAAWLANWTWPVGYALVLVGVPLLFPDGRALGRRWGSAGVVGAVGALCMMVGAAVRPGSDPDLPEVANPYAVHTALGDALGAVGSVLLVTALIAAFGSVIVRYRRSAGRQRLQLRWFLFAVGLLVAAEAVVPIITVAAGGSVDTALAVSEAVSAPWLAVAIGVAVLRHGLYDIDVFLNRTLVYAVMTAGVVAAYVLVVTYFAAALRVHGSGPSLVATGLVAVLFHPARERVQRGVNRLLYGHRGEPLVVLTDFGRRLESSRSPSVVLGVIADTVRDGLRVPYVRVELADVDCASGVAESGAAAAVTVRVPLMFGASQVGELAVASRGPAESFTKADMSVIDELARHAGVAAYAVRVAADLQAARERLVGARAEERRRLRRDLHDGFGSRLASQPLTLDAARALIRSDPARAEGLLIDMREQSQQSVAALREIINNLRPPMLDDRGLLAALQGEVSCYTATGLAVTLKAPTTLPPLPAAVEVALLRIATEAVTNAARHSHAGNCRVTLDVAPSLLEVCLQVVDDGVGMSSSKPAAGVGLLSMRERAAELGGHCDIAERVGGGTQVSVRLPLAGGGP